MNLVTDHILKVISTQVMIKTETTVRVHRADNNHGGNNANSPRNNDVSHSNNAERILNEKVFAIISSNNHGTSVTNIVRNIVGVEGNCNPFEVRAAVQKLITSGFIIANGHYNCGDDESYINNND
jgi:hypothetical protein